MNHLSKEFDGFSKCITPYERVNELSEKRGMNLERIIIIHNLKTIINECVWLCVLVDFINV